MRALRLLIIVALAAISTVSAAHAQTQWTAVLTGAAEVPPVNTPGTGTFEAALSADQTVMTFTLTYQNLVGTTTQAHIHRGAAGVPGPVLYFLSAGPFASGLAGATDPAPSGGSTGFLPADVTDLQNGGLYVNIHTSAFTGGEIRGQIVSAVAVQSQTWGRIKDLFR